MASSGVSVFFFLPLYSLCRLIHSLAGLWQDSQEMPAIGLVRPFSSLLEKWQVRQRLSERTRRMPRALAISRAFLLRGSALKVL